MSGGGGRGFMSSAAGLRDKINDHCATTGLATSSGHCCAHPVRLRALGAVKRRRVNPARRAQGASGLIDADKSSSDAPRRVGDAVTDEVVHGPP